MYLLANLPEQYGAMYTIQKYNYPFNKTFVHYVRSVSELSAHLGYGIFKTIGYIEDKLLFIGATPTVDDTRHKVTFKIKVDDPAIERFYSTEELSNKQITLLLVRLAISLSEVYTPSLTHMAYLISELTPVSGSQTHAAYLDRRDIISEPAPVATPAPVSRPVPPTVDVSAPVVTPAPVTPAPVTQAPATPAPVATPEPVEHKPKKKLITEAAVLGESASSATDDEDDSSKKIADAKQTISKLRETLTETREEPGQEVVTNPLLADFMDF